MEGVRERDREGGRGEEREGERERERVSEKERRTDYFKAYSMIVIFNG